MQDHKPCGCQDQIDFEGVDRLPKAMAYVPWQEFHQAMPLDKALQVGTIFPDLCKPFCGRRVTR